MKTTVFGSMVVVAALACSACGSDDSGGAGSGNGGGAQGGAGGTGGSAQGGAGLGGSAQGGAGLGGSAQGGAGLGGSAQGGAGLGGSAQGGAGLGGGGGGTGKCSATSPAPGTAMKSCDMTPTIPVCNEYTGSGWTSDSMTQACTGANGTLKDGKCPAENLKGSCQHECGGATEWVSYGYTTGAENKSDCESMGGKWLGP